MRTTTLAVAACVLLLAQLNGSIGQEQNPKDGSRQQAAERNGGDGFSIPIRILPDPLQDQKAKADAEKSQRDEKREDDNLAVQRSVAESSDKVAQYAAPMFYLGAIGLGLSLVTVIASGLAAWFALKSVREARAATAIAQRALLVTEDTAKKQLRAYLTLEGAEVPATASSMLYAVVGLKNFGQTPATITHIGHVCLAASKILPKDLDALQLMPYTSVIGGGGTVHFHAANQLVRLQGLDQAVAAGQLQIAVRIALRYKDIFGDEHSAQFTRTIETARNLHGGLGISPSYPDLAT